jgi:hypothetical protein
VIVHLRNRKGEVTAVAVPSAEGVGAPEPVDEAEAPTPPPAA